jgi:hypothetical protein
MDKETLADIIHEVNVACKDTAKNGRDCRLCYRIAGQVQIIQAVELQHEGAKLFSARKSK